MADVSVSVAPSEVLWLSGPNGSGKTTMLLACAGLIAPDSGTLEWVPGPARAVVALAAHDGPERDGLTLGEELATWQALHRDPMPLGRRLLSVGLGGREHAPVSGLSAGQRKRLALARLLGSGKPAWLMDEPMAGLDADGRALVTTCLQAHLADGGLAVIASHQPFDGLGASTRVLHLEVA